MVAGNAGAANTDRMSNCTSAQVTVKKGLTGTLDLSLVF